MKRISDTKKHITPICAVLTTALLSLTGCGNAIPDMTPDVEQRVGEYAAVVMLRYDANHRSRLTKLPEEYMPVEEVVEEPEEEIAEEIPEEEVVEEEYTVPVIDNSSKAEEEEKNLSPEEFLGFADGVSLIYQGYSVSSSYPEDTTADSYFSLDATAGKKLVVLHFNLYNGSGSDQSFDFLNDDNVFKAVFNGNTARTALLTMNLDDMNSYVGTIPNGYGEELVLIFEENESIEISSIDFSIKNKTGKCSVALD